MTHSLALYNAHKRATLDRLTLTFQLQIRALFRRLSANELDVIISHLEAGHRDYTPNTDLPQLDKHLQVIFKKFQDAAIKAGFSDGLQEVSPEGKLNLWAKYPITMPVEDTIVLQGGHALAEKRKTLFDEFLEQNQKTLEEKISDYVRGTKSAYLKNIRKTYAASAKKWFAGESDLETVKSYLKKALYSTDAEAERVLRTETTNYFNYTRAEYFQKNTDVDYVELYAVTDGRISDICETRHGYCVPIEKAKLKKYCPAFHPHCRTVQRPLFSSLPSHKRIIEKSERMDERKFAPLPKGWV